MKTFDHILQGSEATEQNAYDHAQQFDFSESEVTEQNIKYKTYIDTVRDIEIYYDYGANYYFFAPVEQ